MKLSSILLSVVLPATILGHPTLEPESNSFSERAEYTCIVTTSGVRYRICPKLSCSAVGQYNKGKKLYANSIAHGDSIQGIE